jgi:hypothetical protein
VVLGTLVCCHNKQSLCGRADQLLCTGCNRDRVCSHVSMRALCATSRSLTVAATASAAHTVHAPLLLLGPSPPPPAPPNPLTTSPPCPRMPPPLPLLKTEHTPV